MMGLDVRRAFQISDGARQLQDAVEGAGAHAQLRLEHPFRDMAERSPEQRPFASLDEGRRRQALARIVQPAARYSML